MWYKKRTRLEMCDTSVLFCVFSNSQCDQLPVGLIAQLVEPCADIGEVMGSSPVPLNFFQALISQPS